MSNSIKYAVEGNVQEIKDKLTEILAKEITKSYVKTSWNNMQLAIIIEKVGSSEIKFDLKSENNRCIISESKRSIAFMHKPFIGEVESMVNDLLTKKLGAVKV